MIGNNFLPETYSVGNKNRFCGDTSCSLSAIFPLLNANSKVKISEHQSSHNKKPIPKPLCEGWVWDDCMTLKIDLERLSLSLRCFCRVHLFAFAEESRLYIVECLCSDIAFALCVNIAYTFFDARRESQPPSGVAIS